MTSLFQDVPIETDRDQLAQDVYDKIVENVPGWQQFPGNLESFMIEGFADGAGDARDIAADVPKAIFRYFGASVLQLPPIESLSASVTATVTLRDALGHTIPAGTQYNIPSPGGEPVAFEQAEDVLVPIGSNTTATGEVLLTAIEPGTIGNGLSNTPFNPPLAYIDTVTLIGETAGGVDAEDDDAYLNRLVEHLQLLAPRPILPDDFSVFARDIGGVERALALDGYNPAHNLLTANQSNAETGTTGMVTAGTNCTLSQSATQAAEGSDSFRLSSAASGDMFTTTSVGTSGIAVSPGDTYTARFDSRAGAAGRNVDISILWYNSSGTLLGSGTSLSTANNTAGWASYAVSAVAPATAAFAAIQMAVRTTGGAGELHYFDRLQLRRGTTNDWVVGGTPADNNERTVTVALADGNGLAVSSGVKAAVAADLDARREITFNVHTTDPTLTLFDVHFTATTFVGFDPTAVSAAITAAAIAFLNPTQWGVVPFGDVRSWLLKRYLRYGELYSALMRTEGIRELTSLTFRVSGVGSYVSTDFTLPGAAPLAGPGSDISGTVTIP